MASTVYSNVVNADDRLGHLPNGSPFVITRHYTTGEAGGVAVNKKFRFYSFLPRSKTECFIFTTGPRSRLLHLRPLTHCSACSNRCECQALLLSPYILLEAMSFIRYPPGTLGRLQQPTCSCAATLLPTFCPYCFARWLKVCNRSCGSNYVSKTSYETDVPSNWFHYEHSLGQREGGVLRVLLHGPGSLQAFVGCGDGVLVCLTLDRALDCLLILYSGLWWEHIRQSRVFQTVTNFAASSRSLR